MRVQTYLPVFKGFYHSFYDSDIEQKEIEWVDYLYTEYNLDADEIHLDFNYQGYYDDCAVCVCEAVCEELIELGLIKSYKYESLVSPKYYNFRNDSINVEFKFSTENKVRIAQYIKEHWNAFKNYLKDNYTSGSGFISSYSNDVADWLKISDSLEHSHKSGSILNFILTNEGISDFYIYEKVMGVRDYLELELNNYSDILTANNK
jgi:hypothetical protein